MSWTRLDDSWGERRDVLALDVWSRWHLLSLVQWCSRTGVYDGVVRPQDARRCTDGPDPDASLAALVDAGHLEVTDDGAVRVLRIADHVPPPHMRDDARKTAQRERKARSRARAVEPVDPEPVVLDVPEPAPEPAPDIPADPVGRDMPRDVTCDVRRDPGTGQDRTGQDEITTGEPVREDAAAWPAVVPPGSGEKVRCPQCGEMKAWSLLGGRCRRCLGAAPNGRAS